MLSGSGKLVVGNSKEVWSRIDEEEQVMVADDGSRAKQNRKIFEGFGKKLTNVYGEKR
jgi:hypothetical protein